MSIGESSVVLPNMGDHSSKPLPRLAQCLVPLVTIIMNTPNPGTADVIRAVAETLDVICAAQGIEVRNLDDAMIDRLLWSSFEEHLGSGRLVADTLGVKRA
jgi:hypothetical protein